MNKWDDDFEFVDQDIEQPVSNSKLNNIQIPQPSKLPSLYKNVSPVNDLYTNKSLNKKVNQPVQELQLVDDEYQFNYIKPKPKKPPTPSIVQPQFENQNIEQVEDDNQKKQSQKQAGDQYQQQFEQYGDQQFQQYQEKKSQQPKRPNQKKMTGTQKKLGNSRPNNLRPAPAKLSTSEKGIKKAPKIQSYVQTVNKQFPDADINKMDKLRLNKEINRMREFIKLMNGQTTKILQKKQEVQIIPSKPGISAPSIQLLQQQLKNKQTLIKSQLAEKQNLQKKYKSVFNKQALQNCKTQIDQTKSKIQKIKKQNLKINFQINSNGKKLVMEDKIKNQPQKIREDVMKNLLIFKKMKQQNDKKQEKLKKQLEDLKQKNRQYDQKIAQKVKEAESKGVEINESAKTIQLQKKIKEMKQQQAKLAKQIFNLKANITRHSQNTQNVIKSKTRQIQKHEKQIQQLKRQTQQTINKFLALIKTNCEKTTLPQHIINKLKKSQQDLLTDLKIVKNQSIISPLVQSQKIKRSYSRDNIHNSQSSKPNKQEFHQKQKKIQQVQIFQLQEKTKYQLRQEKAKNKPFGFRKRDQNKEERRWQQNSSIKQQSKQQVQRQKQTQKQRQPVKQPQRMPIKQTKVQVQQPKVNTRPFALRRRNKQGQYNSSLQKIEPQPSTININKPINIQSPPQLQLKQEIQSSGPRRLRFRKNNNSAEQGYIPTSVQQKKQQKPVIQKPIIKQQPKAYFQPKKKQQEFKPVDIPKKQQFPVLNLQNQGPKKRLFKKKEIQQQKSAAQIQQQRKKQEKMRLQQQMQRQRLKEVQKMEQQLGMDRPNRLKKAAKVQRKKYDIFQNAEQINLPPQQNIVQQAATKIQPKYQSKIQTKIQMPVKKEQQLGIHEILGIKKKKQQDPFIADLLKPKEQFQPKRRQRKVNNDFFNDL